MGRDMRCAVCSEATSGWTTRVRLGKAPDEMSTDGLELDGRGEMGRDTRCALKLLAAGQGGSELWMQNISPWPVRWSCRLL
ncbi:hypothetical protein ACQJBY_056950 [Aegilops geniculata]